MKKITKKEEFSMVSQKKLIPTVLLLFVLCIPGVPDAVARMQKDKRVADVMIGPTGISWIPKVNFSRLMLTVSRPDGSIFEKAFDSGSSPYLDLGNILGERFNDGSYTYELRVIPIKSKRVHREDGEAIGTNKVDSRGETLTQTGYFQVQGGMMVVPANTSEDGLSGAMVFTHTDDVIINDSLCVGSDCDSSVLFGASTIVLMENNLQIFFDDTSTLSNYPDNDWKFICNDTIDGGGNYFALMDATAGSNILVLEAGAEENSLYVDSHGDVGIHTSNPFYELHITDGDTPTIRLDQDESYGWPAQKWDLGANELCFFIRDATNSSKRPFKIEPDSPSDSIFINSSGNIGFGTSAPEAKLEIETTEENASLKLDRTDGATGDLTARANAFYMGTSSNHNVRFVANDIVEMTLEPGGNFGIGLADPYYKLHIAGGAYCDGGAWMPGSSREYKENIKALSVDEALNALDGLKPMKFNYKTNKNEDYIGFIAEDVPELLATKERKSVSPMDVVSVLTIVVQEQQKTISQLKKKIAELEKKLD
jgi:hypothetical protein